MIAQLMEKARKIVLKSGSNAFCSKPRALEALTAGNQRGTAFMAEVKK